MKMNKLWMPTVLILACGIAFTSCDELEELVNSPVEVNAGTPQRTYDLDWKITDQFSDMTLHQRDGEQHELQKLIANRDKYDLLLVQNLNDIHWRTSNFCRIREALELDIYSLQDGYLEFC